MREVLFVREAGNLALATSHLAQSSSLPAQPRDDGACRGEPCFIIRRVSRITAVADGFKRLIDLAERGLSHAGVPPPLGKEHQRDAFIAKTPGPLERHALPGPFLPLAIGGDSLFKLYCPVFLLPKAHKRTAQTVLGHCPLERHTLARPFLQRLAIGGDGVFQLRRPVLASSKNGKRTAQIVLGHGPVERHTLARPFLQRLAIGSDSLFKLRRPPLA